MGRREEGLRNSCVLEDEVSIKQGTDGNHWKLKSATSLVFTLDCSLVTDILDF